MFVRIIVTVFILLLPTVAVVGQEELTKTNQPVWSCKSNSWVSTQEIASQLSNDDVIVLGEQHNNDSGHEFQLEIIKKLVDSGAKVTISMEQFERDVQGAVNDYLAGRIDEEKFLATSRPWKNYQKHYRPIIEFAKANRMHVIAANSPTRIANLVAKGEAIRSSDQVFLPRNTTAPENVYWENFVAAMKGHVGTDGTNQLKSYYQSQCLKDDSMAEAITDYLSTHRHEKKVVVHLCGHMHSDYGLGTVARILHRQPLTRISVIAMETLPESGEPDPKSVANRAHFVLWTTPIKAASDAK